MTPRRDQLALQKIPERFEILERLGSGAFGTVYRAEDREFGTIVALKALNYADPGNLQHFKREFRSLARISHPNLVDLFELVALDDLWFFTMDCIEGLNFREAIVADDDAAFASAKASSTLDFPSISNRRSAEWLPSAGGSRHDEAGGDRRDGEAGTDTVDIGADATGPSDGSTLFPVDFDSVRTIFEELVRAVTALHDFGKLHRDLKPDNVLVTAERRVVLLDFGMVAELDAHELSNRPGPGSGLVGTPRYLAPELITDTPITEATDWYSVGVMLYEVLTGRPPFSGKTTLQQLLRKSTRDPTPVREYRPDTPKDLAQICVDLLASSPEDRPDGRTLLERLASPTDSTKPPTRIASRGDRRRPFVGRRPLLRRLDAVAETCFGETRPAVVNVFGGSGVGKSTLIRHFLDDFRADDPEAVVLQARCHENEAVPYKALDGIVDAMVPWLKDIPEDTLADVLGNASHAYAVGQLFPVLRQLYPVASGDLDWADLSESQLRNRGFQALERLLDALARRHHLVLFIDDAQWGDEDSAVLLDRLLSGPAPPPCLLVCTWRDDDVETSPFLGPFLESQEDLAPGVRRVDMPVGALDEHATRRLAESLTDGADTRRDVDSIVRESRGNPFFVFELSRSPAGDRRRSREAELDDLVVDRIRRLPQQARTLLELVAVAGQPIGRDLLHEACGDGDPGLFSTLRSGRLVRSTGGQPPKLQAYHDRIREAVIAHLTPPEHTRHHRTLAETLEASDHGDPEQLATHWKGAGDPLRAADYMVQAAERAADALAFEHAVQCMEDALKLGEWPRTRRFELLRRLAELRAALGWVDGAARAYRRAAEEAEGLDATECRINAAEQTLRAGRIDEGTELLFEQFRTLGFDPAESRGKMVASILYQRWKLGRRGFQYQLRPPKVIPRRKRLLLDALAVATTMFGVIDAVRGGYFHYQGLHRALETGYPSRLVTLLCQQAAQDAATNTAPDRAARALEAASELLPACRTGRENLRAYCTFVDGMRDYFAGRWAPAADDIQQAVDMMGDRCPDLVWETETFEYFRFDCLQRLGRLDQMREQLPRVFDPSSEQGSGFHAVLYRTKLAYLALADDAPDEAARQLATSRQAWSYENYAIQDFRILEVAVALDLYRGRLERAWQRVGEDWGPLRRSLLMETKLVGYQAWALRGRAAAALAGQVASLRGAKLRMQARRAARQLRDTGQRWVTATADVIDAKLANDAGDTGRAVEMLDAAQTRFRQSDMRLHADSARLALGDISGTEKAKRNARNALASLKTTSIKEPEKMARTAVGLLPD